MYSQSPRYRKNSPKDLQSLSKRLQYGAEELINVKSETSDISRKERKRLVSEIASSKAQTPECAARSRTSRWDSESTIVKYPKQRIDKQPILKWLQLPRITPPVKREPNSQTHEPVYETNCCSDFFESKRVFVETSETGEEDKTSLPAQTIMSPLVKREVTPILSPNTTHDGPRKRRSSTPPRRIVLRSSQPAPKTPKLKISTLTVNRSAVSRSDPEKKSIIPSQIAGFTTPRSAVWTPAPRDNEPVVEVKRRRTLIEFPKVVCSYSPDVQEKAPFVSYGSIPTYDIAEYEKIGEQYKYIDTHCHLDFLFKRLSFKGTLNDYISNNAKDYPEQYGGCVAVFCDPSTFSQKNMWEPLIQEEDVWAAFGCHPHLVHSYDEKAERSLLVALEHHKVVALGEIGLDYSPKNNCDHDMQKTVFIRQIQLALDRNLPLVIHSRNADEDTISILRELVPSDHKIHWHCFTRGWQEAKPLLKEFQNLFLGLTALVTFPTAKHVHEVARRIPLDRLLLETDSPYFLPRNEPMHQRWSSPGMAAHVAAQIAAFRADDTLEDVLFATRRNTRIMYGI